MIAAARLLNALVLGCDAKESKGQQLRFRHRFPSTFQPARDKGSAVFEEDPGRDLRETCTARAD